MGMCNGVTEEVSQPLGVSVWNPGHKMAQPCHDTQEAVDSIERAQILVQGNVGCPRAPDSDWRVPGVCPKQ